MQDKPASELSIGEFKTLILDTLKVYFPNNTFIPSNDPRICNSFLSTQDLKDMFHITPKILSELIEAGKLTEYRIGRRRLFKASEIYSCIQVMKNELKEAKS